MTAPLPSMGTGNRSAGVSDSAPAGPTSPRRASTWEASAVALPGRDWAFGGYHPWNAYCGRALAGGPIGIRASGSPGALFPSTARVTRPSAGRTQPEQPPVLAAYQRSLHDLHRLAARLDRLRLDPRTAEGWRTLPVEVHHQLADTLEILTEIRDCLPTRSLDPVPHRVPAAAPARPRESTR